MATKSHGLRVVLDTNVIIAALRSANPRSPTVELLDRWARNGYSLLYSDDLLAEYVDKLSKRSVSPVLIRAFLSRVMKKGEYVLVADRQIAAVTVDPDDDRVLACAVVGKATHLVTYDPHLTVIGQTFRKVKIMSVLEFLAALRANG